MNKRVTKGIILGRFNYGEADRILTIITPDYGKIRVIAKGVRKEKSKLAGGIELFCVSHISYIPGKRDIGTLVSTRLATNFGAIVKDLHRTQLGYRVLQTIDKVTEDECEGAFFDLVVETLQALDGDVDSNLTEAWFDVRLLRLLGHEPNVYTDTNDQALVPAAKYRFDYTEMAFDNDKNGSFGEDHIKLLRLMLTNPIRSLTAVGRSAELAVQLRTLTNTILQQQL